MSGATPRKSKQSVDISDLYSRRESLIRVIGGIPECPLEYFLDNLLPPLPDGASTVLVEVKNQLGIISGWTAKYEFSEPEKSKLSEDRTFATLCRVFNDVNKACHDKSTKPMILKMPDSCFVLRETKSAPPSEQDEVAWCDVAVMWEYKKQGAVGGHRDNAKKIIWTMSQILALDPCRRFTFGLTVENDGIRIWFCDRSAYMVSGVLPYLNCDTIIDIFIRFALASEQHLGYDPSITRVLDYRQTVQYDIQMPARGGLRVFRTKRILANHSADRATGRGTRVWEVYDRDGEDVNKTHALKDAWVETSRPREAETYRAVLAGASEEEKKYFLTVLSDGDVELAPGVADTTLGTRNGSPPTAFKVFSSLVRNHSLLVFTKPEESTSTSQVPQDPKKVRAFVNRAHYRVLFAEVGILISELRDMGMIWQAACHANKGLIVMLKTQHIHRDVSAGNILMCDGQGKITDLEFSARFDPETDGSGIHASLTGTANFMSAELFRQRYLYLPASQPIRRNHQNVKSVHRFFQNYLHDAESLWWVVLWCLARLDPQGRQLAKDEQALGRRRELYMQWFPRENRQLGNAFDQPLNATVDPDSLMNHDLPEVYRPIQLILDEWRVAIGTRIFKMQASQFGKVVFEGIQDVHFDVDAVINSEESLNVMQQVGELELIEGLL